MDGRTEVGPEVVGSRAVAAAQVAQLGCSIKGSRQQ